MKIFLHLIVSSLAILITTYIVPGVSITLLSSIVLAVVLGAINAFIKPIIGLITLPINIITLGLFSLVTNTLLIILATKIVPSFYITSFWSAFWFSITLALINAFFGLIKAEKE